MMGSDVDGASALRRRTEVCGRDIRHYRNAALRIWGNPGEEGLDPVWPASEPLHTRGPVGCLRAPPSGALGAPRLVLLQNLSAGAAWCQGHSRARESAPENDRW